LGGSLRQYVDKTDRIPPAISSELRCGQTSPHWYVCKGNRIRHYGFHLERSALTHDTYGDCSIYLANCIVNSRALPSNISLGRFLPRAAKQVQVIHAPSIAPKCPVYSKKKQSFPNDVHLLSSSPASKGNPKPTSKQTS